MLIYLHTYLFTLALKKAQGSEGLMNNLYLLPPISIPSFICKQLWTFSLKDQKNFTSQVFVFGILSLFSLMIRSIAGAFPTLVVYGDGKGLGKSGATASVLHAVSCRETRCYLDNIDPTHIRQSVCFLFRIQWVFYFISIYTKFIFGTLGTIGWIETLNCA